MNDQQDSLGNIWKGGAIILGTFILTLVIYFSCVRFLDSAKARFQPLARWSEPTERNPVAGAPAAGRGPIYSPISPGISNVAPRVTSAPVVGPGYGLTQPLTTNPPNQPRPIVAIQYDPRRLYFSDTVTRKRAQDAVYSLRLTVESIRKLDGSSFWAPLPLVNAAPPTEAAAPEDMTTGRLFVADTEDPAKKRQAVISRIINETEAMATELALVAHPDQFPEALREQVKQIGTEARIYLSTVQLALNNPAERDEMRTLAQEHLHRSESLLKSAQIAVGIL